MKSIVLTLFFTFSAAFGENLFAMEIQNETKFIVVGGGCFWCTEAVFQRMKGVVKVESGYAGGKTKNPTYKEICTGTTGHAEVIKIYYEPSKVKLEDILEVFFLTHDPTTLNRQGNDIGTQYRSVIFYADEKEREIAEKMKNTCAKYYTSQIVTEISPSATFYKAEEYHQNYYDDNSSQPYCQFVVLPKIQKFRKLFKDKVKE